MTLKKASLKRLIDQRYLLLLSVPFVAWLIVFRYIPLSGWAMAFQDYKPSLGFFQQSFAGLKHFKALFQAPLFYQALQNTLGMSFLGLVFGFTTSKHGQAWQYTLPPDVNAKVTEADDLAKSTLANLVLGRPEDFDAGWAKFMADLRAIGIEEANRALTGLVKDKMKLWGTN